METLTFSSIPLHAVLGGDLSKAVLDNRSQLIVVEMIVVNLGSEVELSLGLEFVVQPTCTASAAGWGRRAPSAGCCRRVASRSGHALRVPVTGKTC